MSALVASAVLAAATAASAQVRSVPMRPAGPPMEAGPGAMPPASLPPVPAAAPAAAPEAGNPDDPANALSREPGDLMSSGTLVYVDDSFGSVEKLRTAIHYASQGQAQAAISAFQEIIDQFGQKLVLLNDNSYVSITDYVHERLLAMPAVKNGMYDQLYGLDARKAVDDAIANRDVATLIRMCDRYFPSAAALKGLAQAAEWYFERGEFSAAALTWSKLLVHPLAAERKPEFLFYASLAEHLSQDGRNAARFHDQLAKDYADASANIGGKPVKLLGKLDELLAQPAWEAAALAKDEWPAFQGGPSRSMLLPSDATIGAKLWNLPMADMSGDGSSVSAPPNQVQVQQALQLRQMQMAGEVVVDGQGGLGSYPVLSNGDIFVHQGNQILALSVSSGARLWTYPQSVTPDASVAAMIRSTGVNPRLTGHNSVSVVGDYVYAVLPPMSGAPVRYTSDGMVVSNSRVVCLRRDDGSQVWSRTSEEVKVDKDASLAFIGSPLVTRQGVFVMARRASDQNFTAQYLVRLDRDTGTPTWYCYLCSTMNVYGTGLGVNIPVPTLVDDVLYINTGQGADCAVDANAGRILWLRVTADKSNNGNGDMGANLLGNARRGMVMVDNSWVTPQVPSWKSNPPLILGDKMLTTDSQYLRIYDRWNGKVLKTLRVSDLIAPGTAPGMPTLDVLAGAIGSKIIMSIRNTALCFELASLLTDHPQPEWAWTPTGAGTAMGRPFLTTTGYYVPFTNKLVRVDVKTGTGEAWDWPTNDKKEPGKPGNLLVTSEQVIVVNDLEVSGYSKWEVARDNRLARIKAAPQDPAPYLDLAEVAFRTNHQELAQENMKQAVDLANAGSVPGGTVREMLARLYRTNLAFAELLLADGDTAQRDQSRFYFEQCRATARSPEQGAQWRLRLAELSDKQKKYDEEAMLFSEILADPALRAAGYQEPEIVQSAAASAEQQMKKLILKAGPDVYQRYETQAAALAQRGTTARDAASLQQVVDVYPNSAAALSAAAALADIDMEKQDWEAARRVLWWLQPRVEGPAQARAIANLAQASIGLKKYSSAAAWVARGSRQFKDFSWTQGGQKLTFEELKSQVLKAGGDALDYRLPALPRGLTMAKMETAPLGLAIANASGNEPGTQLLAPVETAPAVRQSNLIFIRSGGELHIRDAARNEESSAPVRLPSNAPTVLLGATRDFAVLLQAGTAIGVDLKTHDTWTLALSGAPRGSGTPVNRGPMAVNLNGGGFRQQIRVGAGSRVEVVDGNWVLNGNPLGPVDSIQMVDDNGNIIQPNGGSDPEAVRRAGFLPLGSGGRFTTAKLLNGNLLVLSGNQLTACNIETGKLLWTSTALPSGTASCFVGNEDLIVIQADEPGGKASTFWSIDAQTGKLGKTLKLENERVLWRALGDDGTLYVVTDSAVAAYDLVSTKNVWRYPLKRAGAGGAGGGAGARFASATALTLDGLIFVTDDYQVHCLSLESGVDRWSGPPQAELRLGLNRMAGSAAVRSTVVGDMVVFQSAEGSAAFKTQPQPPAASVGRDYSPQLAWTPTYPQNPPPCQGMQVASGYLVELLMGQATGKSRCDVFVIRDTLGGGLKANPQLSGAGEDPLIRSWQVVDGGIVFETVPNGVSPDAANVSGTVYFWRVKPGS